MPKDLDFNERVLFFLQNTTSTTGSPTGRRRDPVTAAYGSIMKWTL